MGMSVVWVVVSVIGIAVLIVVLTYWMLWRYEKRGSP